MRLKYPYENRLSESFGIIPTISLWLDVIAPKKLVPFFFLFDTGADVSSLPVKAAKELGIDLNKCPEEQMSGIEGTSITVFCSKIKILFNNKSFIIPCVFNPNKEVPLLLGRAGILDKFTINLDAKKRVATFEEI